MPYTAPPTSDQDPDLPNDDPGTMPFEDVIRQAIDARTLALRVSMPAKVVAVVGEQKVDIKPLLKTRPAAARAAIDQSIIQAVPVAMPMGANWFIKMPLAVGDVGLALFCDRSLDVFLASDGADAVDPADARQHHMADAIFLPGLPTFSRQTQDGTPDLVLSNGENGASQLRIRPDGKFQVKNQSQELLAIVYDVVGALSALAGDIGGLTAITLPSTAAGPPSPELITKMQAFVQRVNAIQTNLATLKV